jgi:hypothetical protein
MTRRHAGRAVSAKRHSAKTRLQPPLETKSMPIGWERPPQRPVSSCPVCWEDLSCFAWCDVCPRCSTELSR